MTSVTEALVRITNLKWNWAGHVARFADGRETKKILEWRLRQDSHCSRGCSPSRWSDDIKRIQTNWMIAAQDRQEGLNYGKQWTQTGWLMMMMTLKLVPKVITNYYLMWWTTRV